ncbi:uncharacterized protein LOC128882686 isoform X2 [Hylaeus volcanicus]|nr:uncharacterized protein LOC128882686 isoform X2 [Hylaeus volcanicus]
MFEQVNLHDPLYYFEKVFSYEFSLYKEKVNFQNSARHTLWKPDADVNNSLVQKDVEHTRKGCNQSVIGEGSTSYREEGPVKFERSIFINHIEPYDRFTKRLKTQDLRTQQMNTLEYQRFSKAREGVSRTFRTSFHAWLRTTIKNHMQSYDFECSSSPPQLSGCNSQFLLFLVTDRLASLVELAYRLRYFNETLALRLEAKPFVLCEEWFTSSFSRLQQLYNSGNVMNDVSTILLQNEGTIDKNPLEPIYYQHAIALYLNAVDPNQLKLPFQTCIQCFLESFDLCLLNDGTKRKRKYKNPGSLSYQNENRKKKLNQPIRGNEPCETLPGDLNDSCHDSTSGMNQFFDRLIGQISEKRSSTLKLPEKLVVFAFLKCRDIFWKYRHETLTTIWNAVYERFRNQARSVSKDFEQFLQAYNKIIYSIEKMNDILIFESYFKDFFNIHNTLEIFLSNEKNEKSCIQMNTSCDALEKNCV